MRDALMSTCIGCDNDSDVESDSKTVILKDKSVLWERLDSNYEWKTSEDINLVYHKQL